MTAAKADLDALADRAAEAARLLRLLSNEKRLLTLCCLVGGERSVGELAAEVALSQSALSQHLAQLRGDGLVETRRSGQTIWYRLADSKARRILELLHDLYCQKRTQKERT